LLGRLEKSKPSKKFKNFYLTFKQEGKAKILGCGKLNLTSFLTLLK